MNTSQLRRKRVIVPAVVGVAVLGIGSTVWSATAGQDLPVDERDRVGSAATSVVGGTVREVETSDDPGEAYEVDVRLEDGTEVDVSLDADLAVVREERDDRDDRDDSEDGDDSDDRVLSATERGSAGEAALAEIGGGTVLDVEASDDRGEAYEVEVRDTTDREWDVDLDADFQVLRTTADD